MAVLVVVMGLGIVVMIAVSQEIEPAFRYYYAGLLLVLTYSFTVVRLRFRPTVICCAIIIAGYEFVAVLDQRLLADGLLSGAGPVFLNNNFFLVAAGVITTMGAYLLEDYSRKDFYQRELIGAEKQTVEEQKLRITEQRDELAITLGELTATQDQLVQTERMAVLGKLAAGIAHEINNPVGIVVSAADNSARCVQRIHESLTSDSSIEEIRADRRFQQALSLVGENAQVIVDASERIAKVVQSLSAFAQPDEQGYKRTSVEDCIERTLALLQYAFGERVQLVKQFGKTPQIIGNPGEINQVLLTVISNAAQAIDGEGEVVIATTRQGGLVRIEIEDTGRGMSPEQIDGLFDLGFKKTGSRVGVGMGLVHAKAIVERHQGLISVSSKLGKGTRFRIELPVSVSS